MGWLAVSVVSVLLVSCTSFFLPETNSQDDGELWVVIVVGGKGINNYGEHANACHAYHILKDRGIKDDRIILLMRDDVANSDDNPFKGKLFNHPSLSHDVYKGCTIDYNSSNVTPETFKNVLIGNNTGDGPVLESTEKDRLFIYFTDHGGPDVLLFPDAWEQPEGQTFSSADLDESLRIMTEKKMYKEILFYVEACESGSVTENVIPKYPNVLAITAASPTENAAMTYCKDYSGNYICLGCEFSVAWLEYDDANNTNTHTLQDQFEVIKAGTKYSHASIYGDRKLLNRKISDFQGVQKQIRPQIATDKYEYESIPIRQVPIWRREKQLQRAVANRNEEEIARLQMELLELKESLKNAGHSTD
ncbi:unnamed protein product [Bursaphelenchus xylophilus]|nr:unnamed protein product [Bursaphelenchus xylophilus]CAG9104543.1 unnamed protein product [Bursaphelenchus xylophilus]